MAAGGMTFGTWLKFSGTASMLRRVIMLQRQTTCKFNCIANYRPNRRAE
jgi:hypothetical protein